MAPIKRPPMQRRRTYFQEWREFSTDLSQTEVAQRIGYNHSSVQRLEAGKLSYNQRWLEVLAKVYRCEPHDLISRDPFGSRAIRSDVIKAYESAPAEVQRQVMAAARALLKTKTSPR
jgi:DNA-binding Xre family transcriptional regulator